MSQPTESAKTVPVRDAKVSDRLTELRVTGARAIKRAERRLRSGGAYHGPANRWTTRKARKLSGKRTYSADQVQLYINGHRIHPVSFGVSA